MHSIRILSLAVALLTVAGCAGTPASNVPPDSPVGGSPGTGTVVSPADGPPGNDSLLVRLEREAAALARTSGCSTADQCRSAPVGNRPCGGPRHYLPYCPASTDSVALFSKLDELSRAEGEYNRRHGLVSTCEFRMPPELEVAGGVCRARPTP